MSLVSALVVLAPLVVTFAFVLVALRRVSADHEVSVTIRLLPCQVVVKVGPPPNGAWRQVENGESGSG